ncbi:MAG: PD-(D/E)XK nuclease family protein [Acidobacteriota bacterium]
MRLPNHDTEIATFFSGLKAREDEHTAQIRADLAPFWSGVITRLEWARSIRERYDASLSPRWNVLELIGPDENRLSDIIAMFLSADDNHGQGRIYLDLFMKAIGEDSLVGRRAIVRREDPTTHIANCSRRVDITLDFGGFAVGIENKPWALEQQDQVNDYCLHLSRKFQKNYKLIYLSGDGSEPVSIDGSKKAELIRERRLRVMAYPIEFLSWLKCCWAESRSEKMRLFLADFVDYVQNNFRLVS